MPFRIHDSDVDLPTLIDFLDVAKPTPELATLCKKLVGAVEQYDPDLEGDELHQSSSHVARIVRVIRHAIGLPLTDGFILILVQEILGGGEIYQPRRPLPNLLADLPRLKAVVERLDKSPSKDDFGDYVTATDIRTNHTPDGVVLEHRRLVKFLELHPDIRKTRPPGKDGTPKKNRLIVHLGDWHKHREALIEWDSDQSDSIPDVSEEEQERRTQTIRARKQRKK